MPLLRQGIEIEDTWTTIATDDQVLLDPELPPGDIIVPYGRLAAARQRQHKGKLGVVVENDLDFDALKSLIGTVDLIAVKFPSFADGRGFSVAKRLRKLGFVGTLRAKGHVIADQAAFAEACGFDEIEVPEDLAKRQAATDYAKAREAFPQTYQSGFRTNAQGVSILEKRHASN